jgi:hypothetical protein
MRYGFGMARVGQQIAGLGEDRLPGQIAVGVLTKVFPPSLVDEVVAAAGVGEQRIRVLPARLVVYYNLAMIVFFQSSYGQVWTKLVGGLGWGEEFPDAGGGGDVAVAGGDLQGPFTAGMAGDGRPVGAGRRTVGWPR